MTDRWYQRAACRDMDPAIFTDTPGYKRHPFKEAKVVCGGCPVQLECLADALKPPDLPHWQEQQTFAMFQAGLTPQQLTKLYLQQESRKAA